jgi:hypothetical protein
MEPGSVSRLCRENLLRTCGLSGKYVKNEYNEGEAPERSVDVEIAIH